MPASVHVLVLQHAFGKGMMLGQQNFYPLLMQPPSPTGEFKCRFTEDHLNIYFPQIIFLVYLVGARIWNFTTLCSARVSISPHFHSH